MWQRPDLDFTPAHRRTLRGLTITETEPGPIVRDLETLLSFVRERELGLSAKNHLPPRKLLPDINQRLTNPIEIGLKRPQLKSFPHIRGLYLLLRASGLGQVAGSASKPVLALHEEVYASWQALNVAERYCTLLETWALRGDPEVLGEHSRAWSWIGEHFMPCIWLIDQIPDRGLTADDNDRWLYSPGPTGVALMELFGFLRVESGPRVEGEGWQIRRIYRTPVGEAMLALLNKRLFENLESYLALDDDSLPEYGTLQPTLKPFVPQWRHNLEMPTWTHREGIHTFKANLGRGLWRRIRIPGGLPLSNLASAVLNAYDFDHDHLDQFSYQDQFGAVQRVNHPYMDEGPWTNEVLVGDVPLRVGGSIEYLFDFGDQWEFTLTLERVDPPDPAVTAPVLVDGKGEAPAQYGTWT